MAGEADKVEGVGDGCIMHGKVWTLTAWSSGAMWGGEVYYKSFLAGVFPSSVTDGADAKGKASKWAYYETVVS